MGFEGVITALITPFDNNGELYEEGVNQLVNFQFSKGINGLFILGTYGSGPLMSVNQRKKAAEKLLESAKSKITVIIHVGASSIDDALSLAKHAQDIGADAIASVPPFYYAYSEESIIDYYMRLVSTVSIPVFAYNNPARTGIRITPELLKKLSEIGIIGIKDSSFDIILFYEYLTTIENKSFIFITGTEALLLPSLLAGAKGAVSGLANAFPELVVECYKLVREGKYTEAAQKQLEIIKVRKILHEAPVIPLIYEILRLRGVNAGYPKSPFKRIKEDKVKEILLKLKKIKLIE